MSDEGTSAYHEDAFGLGNIALDGDVLQLTVSYTGGCERHRFDVLARAVTIARDDAEADLVVAHDARGDQCKALVTEHLEFSLTPVLALCGHLPAVRLTIGDRYAIYRPGGDPD
jgi:hypothetical protein